MTTRAPAPSGRLLRGAVADVAPLRLGVDAPSADRDPVTRALIADATTIAYEHGHRDGLEAGHAAARSALERSAAGITAAADAAVVAIRDAMHEHSQEVLELSRAIAEAILGHEPHDGGASLATRVLRAVGEIDDAPLTVRVHPGDADTVSGMLDGRTVTVVSDTALSPGEALVEGPWARAELTREAAWEAVRRVFDDHAR